MHYLQDLVITYSSPTLQNQVLAAFPLKYHGRGWLHASNIAFTRERDRYIFNVHGRPIVNEHRSLKDFYAQVDPKWRGLGSERRTYGFLSANDKDGEIAVPTANFCCPIYCYPYAMTWLGAHSKYPVHEGLVYVNESISLFEIYYVKGDRWDGMKPL